MIYALFSDGFRAGGENVTRPGVVLPPDYEPDFLDNYELGFKSRWDGGRYTFNLTLFKMEWKDYQVEVVDPGPLYAVVVTNVGDAEIEGMSVDFTAYLWDSLDFGLNAQILDPRVTEGNALVGTRDGDRLPFSPEEKGAVWLEYTYPDEIAGGHVYGALSVDVQRQHAERRFAPTNASAGISDLGRQGRLRVRGLGDLRLRGEPVERTGDPLRPGQRAARHDLDQLAADLGSRLLEELGRQLTAARKPGPPSARTRVERLRKRGHYDRATIDAILDGGLICHVGFLRDRAPVVIPTLYWREGDHLYLHGSAVSRMLDTARKTAICVTVTHIDALVLTRSAFHHSVNYRSVVVFGRPEEVVDPREKEAHLRTFMEGLMPGRWDQLRPVKPKELKATRLLRVGIDEASAKIRSGPPSDDAADFDWPAWGGIIPLAIEVGRPQPDEHVKSPELSPPAIRKIP